MILKNQVLTRLKQKPIVWDAFYNQNGRQKPLVVFCHGYKGFKDWGAWNLVAQEFKKSDLFFVKFNFSHNGGTVDSPIDFPDLEAFAENNYTKELNDLNDFLSHILSDDFQYKNDLDAKNVTVIGHSRGGGISIIKAYEDVRIKKLITWASVSDFGKRTATTGDLEKWKKDGVKYVLNGRTKQMMPHNYQFYEDFKANENRLNIKTATTNLKIPYLIIHGKNDDSILFNEAEDLHRWCSSSNLYSLSANHVFNSSHPWALDKLPKELQLVVEQSITFIKQERPSIS